jgi:aryl-alcohol dehydrogenase-like predicted oxidoreductase
MDYGISNKGGKTLPEKVRKILRYAHENDVDTIDTASTYGESEALLGQSLWEKHSFRLITKTPVYKKRTIGPGDADNLIDFFQVSLKKLRQTAIDGLLAHNAEDLLAEDGEVLFTAMQQIKREGLVKKIGVSVYTGEQIDLLLNRYSFDIIQLPVNVLDKRLIYSGHLGALKARGIEVHARSIFLQGLLLMNPDTLDPFFNPVKPLLRRYHSFLSDNDLAPVEGALCFVKYIPEIDYVIIGVNSLEQLKVNLDILHGTYDYRLLDGFKAFSLNDSTYLNPSLWRLH